MENSPQKRTGFRFVESLIAVTLILILIALVYPSICSPCDKAKLTTALSNGRQIHQAAYRMALDAAESEPPGLAWPGDLAAAPINPVRTTGQFVEYMVNRKYLERGYLAKLFTAPDFPVYPGVGPFEGKYSIFHVFKVTVTDDETALFLATKNFHFGAPLDPKRPYGDKGCAIVRKGGDALSLSAGQAMNKNIGVMPGGTLENPGEQAGNILND